MLNLTAFRNAIVSNLYAKLTRPVIRVDQDGDIPEYPYVTYSISSPYLDLYGHDAERRLPVTDEVLIEYKKTIEVVLSFSCYSEDEDEAQDLCLRIVEHFMREDRDNLRDSGIVVVGISDAQNRSVLLVEHYECRWGIDVRFRLIDRSLNTVDYIEAVEIKKEGD